MNRVKEIREQKGMKQGTLAQITGTAQSEISAIETGRREPGVTMALRIARALDATVEDVFGNEKGRKNAIPLKKKRS